MKNARGLALALGLLIVGGGSNLAATTPSDQQAPCREKPRENAYDGNWWLTKEVDERQAFIDGAGDCMTWVAHVKGLGTAPSLKGRLHVLQHTSRR